MIFIMSLHEFDSVHLLLAKGDSDSLKSLWPKYRILDAARISDVLRVHSENGDKWFLYRDDHGRVFVLRKANVSSGGTATKIELGNFLRKGQSGRDFGYGSNASVEPGTDDFRSTSTNGLGRCDHLIDFAPYGKFAADHAI
jgi:hypothetical protein